MLQVGAHLAAAKRRQLRRAMEHANRHRLGEQRAAQVGDHLEAREPRDQRLRAPDPSDPQAAPEELAERAHREHGCVAREGGERRGRGRLEREVGERHVLDHDRAPSLQGPHRRAARSLFEHVAGRVVTRRDQIDDARRCAGHRLAQSIDREPAGAERHAREPRPERRERVDRAEVGRVLQYNCVAGLDEQVGDQRDRLLRSARDEHLLGLGRESGALQVARDRGAQVGQAERHVAVAAQEHGQVGLGLLPRGFEDGREPVEVSAQEFDLRSAALDQAAEDDVARRQHGGRPAAPCDRSRRRAAHHRSAALPAREPLLAHQRVVGHDDRRPAHPEPAREHALRGQARPRREVAALDRGANRAGEPRVPRAIGARPFAQRLEEGDPGHRRSVHFVEIGY